MNMFAFDHVCIFNVVQGASVESFIASLSYNVVADGKTAMRASFSDSFSGLAIRHSLAHCGTRADVQGVAAVVTAGGEEAGQKGD